MNRVFRREMVRRERNRGGGVDIEEGFCFNVRII